MAVSYFWTINPLECYPTASGESDVVFTAHWQLHAQEIVNEVTWSATSIGTAAVPLHSGSEFIPFEDLTEEEVVAWLDVVADKPHMQQQIQKQINNQTNPQNVPAPLPWAPPSGSGSL